MELTLCPSFCLCYFDKNPGQGQFRGRKDLETKVRTQDRNPGAGTEAENTEARPVCLGRVLPTVGWAHL